MPLGDGNHVHAFRILCANLTLENIYENILTHARNMIHLMVSTFEQELKRIGSLSPTELPRRNSTLLRK